MSSNGLVHQINVSAGGVPKLAVASAGVSAAGVEGDKQKNLSVHGGPDRAVCLYSLELIGALRREGHSMTPGALGENLTLSGIDWALIQPGVRLAIGEGDDQVLLEITNFAAPCELITEWFSDGRSVRVGQKIHPGWSRAYARVVREGRVSVGDGVAVILPG